MKKIYLLLFLVTVSFALTACGASSESGNQTGSPQEEGSSTGGENQPLQEGENSTEEENRPQQSETNQENRKEPVEILNAVWNVYEDGEKFAAGGGDASNIVNDAPGNYSIGDLEGLDATLGFPAEKIDSIDSAASLVHMMNSNVFSCGAYRLKDRKKASDVAEALEKNIRHRQWMCGMPDELIIFAVDDFVVSAYGEKEQMDIFRGKVKSVYENAEFLYEEKIQE